jgi:hypothetical protein
MKIYGMDIRVRGRLIRIAQLEGDKYEFIEGPEAILDGLRRSGRRIDLFTFMQRLPETTPKYAYPFEWDNLAVLPVSTFDHWWTQQLGFKARNKAKQALKKGVVVQEVPFDERLVQGIYEIYKESPIRQGRRFAHYNMSLEKVHAYAATFLDQSVFVGALLDEKLVGFAKLTWDQTRTQANLMHIVSMLEHRDKSPTNALIVQAVRSCADRQIPHLVYANFAYGNKQRDSVTDFKERNGFKRVDVPRYYVPLTQLGKLAFRLGLHHRLADHVPETVAAKFRDLRKSWYSLRFQQAMEG